jgi:hypothetical protein
MGLLDAAVKEARTKPGGSNVGKYPKVESFCGPEGGAPEGSYPVDTLARGRSAIKLAHNAPKPSGIRNCVYKKYPQLRKGKK